MYSPHKHSYLQCRSSGVNPRIINRSVNLARSQRTIDTTDLDPPYLRLSSEQPNIPIKNVDVTRRPQAFGKWALPKLRRELHSKFKTTTIQAINTLMDLLHDPLKAYEAFRLHIPERMFDLLLSKSKEIRECSLMALSSMVGLADGCEILVNNKTFLENFTTVIEDPSPAVRVKAATLMENLSKTWMVAYELVKTDFMPVLLDNLLNEEDVIVTLHLRSLANLFHCEGRVFALKYSAFEIMNELLDRNDSNILCGAANCVGFLAMGAQGKEIAFKIDVLVKLNRLLHDERPEVTSAAAFAIMNCTLLTKAKLRAYEIKDLHERLLALSTGSELTEARIYSRQALTNICEHPCIRKKVFSKLPKLTQRVGLNAIYGNI